MKQLRGIWQDLVDRRLWPVALALLIALVAVPVLIGSGGKSGAKTPVAPATADAAPAPAVAPSQSQLASTATDADVPLRGGKVRDPFSAAVKVAKAAAAPKQTAGAPSTTATSGAPSAGSGVAAATPAAGATASSPASATTGSLHVTKTIIRRTSGTAQLPPVVSVSVQALGAKKPTVLSGVKRLAAAPSSRNPLAFYAGARSDRKALVFLLPTEVGAKGGKCVRATKSSKHCDSLQLRPGQSAMLGVPVGKTTKHYVLKVLSMRPAHTTDINDAIKALISRDKAGEQVLDRAIFAGALPGVGSYTYIANYGVLKQKKLK